MSENKRTPGQKRLFWALTIFIGFIALAILGELFYENIINKILNVIWIVLFALVTIFISIGILVVVGLRKEANKVLDALLEGSLTILDVSDFFRMLVNTVKDVFYRFINFSAPYLAYILGITIYAVLLLIYKNVGKTFDVTILTVVITIILVASTSFYISISHKRIEMEDKLREFKKTFNKTFNDTLEVVIFLFFITMDSTKLFFLPRSLNVPIKAEIAGYNFMERSFFLNGGLKITVSIIVIAIALEIVRYMLRLVAQARKFYTTIDSEMTRVEKQKMAIRMSFNAAKPNMVIFITYTTLLLAVFLIFPRLKLLSMLTASLTLLILDIYDSKRLVFSEKTDLISRIFKKVFRI